jgi:hypothetical protein
METYFALWSWASSDRSCAWLPDLDVFRGKLPLELVESTGLK